MTDLNYAAVSAFLIGLLLGWASRTAPTGTHSMT